MTSPPRVADFDRRSSHFSTDVASLAVALVACKIHRLVITRASLTDSGWTNARAAAFSVAADFGFIVIYAVVWRWVLSKRPLRSLMTIVCRLSTFVLIAAALAEHGFLVATGTTLDWHILKYGVAHLPELAPILVSVGGRRMAFAATFLLAIACLPAALRRSSLAARAANSFAGLRAARLWRRSLMPLSLVSCAFIAPSCLSSSGAPAESSVSSQNLYFRFARTALHDLVSAPGPIHRAGASSVEGRIYEARLDRRYNVVVVILESARAASFSAYGSGISATPFFSQLSHQGALVENAYAVIPHTTKALVSIQCGIYPRLDPEPYEAVENGIPARCLANLLKEGGYQTAFFQPAEENFERRRDLVREFGYEHFAGKQSLAEPTFDESNYLGFEDRVLLKPVMEWVDQQSRPFLLSVLTLASHHPYSVPSGFVPNSHVADKATNDYLNTLAYADEFLRDLFSEFEKRHLLEETIFLVLGDHGEAFGEHGARQHDAVPYEEGLRVPMVWVGPPFRAGHRITGLRQSIDVVPTILEAVGLRLSPHFLPGRSMLTQHGHERLYFSCHYRDYCLASRDARHKLIDHYDRRPAELFDLLFDPDERINLAPRRSIEVAALVHDLKKWKSQVGAQFSEGRQWHVARDVSVSPPSVQHELEVDFGSDVRLLGYDVEQSELPLGEQITIAHHFFVARTPAPGFSFVFHLMGPRPEDLTHPLLAGSYPVAHWKPGDYVTDRFTYFARPGTPLGSYRLMVGLWNGRRVSAGSAPLRASTAGAHIDDESRVATANWNVVAAPLEREEYVYSEKPSGWGAVESMLTSEIGLFGCTLSKDRVKRGVKTALTCLYHAWNDNPVGRICVTLDGPSTRSIEHTPVRGTYPADEWKAGQYVKDQLDIFMLSTDTDGAYRVVVGVEVEEPVEEPTQKTAPSGCGQRGEGVEVGVLTVSD